MFVAPVPVQAVTADSVAISRLLPSRGPDWMVLVMAPVSRMDSVRLEVVHQTPLEPRDRIALSPLVVRRDIPLTSDGLANATGATSRPPRGIPSDGQPMKAWMSSQKSRPSKSLRPVEPLTTPRNSRNSSSLGSVGVPL